MELLNLRSKTNLKLPRCYFFNSFFYPLLSVNENGYNFKRVAKWSKNIDIFSLDKVLIPVHQGKHWCLAVINLSNKRMEYYDSMGGKNDTCVETLRKYIVDEYIAKKKESYELSDWQDYTPGSRVPQQNNGFDCGVFMCKYADYSAQNKNFTFNQSDMPFCRRRMILEILKQDIEFDS